MSEPVHTTMDRIAYARALVASRTQLDARVAELQSRIDAESKATEPARLAYFQRINFLANPSLLDGIIACKRRNDTAAGERIASEYRGLLTRMLESDPVYGLKPIKVDFNRLAPGARPFLAAPFLKLVVGGTFPHLDLDRSDANLDRLVYVTSGGPADLASWRSGLPALNAWFGTHYELTGATATTITLTRRLPLPASIPFAARDLKRGGLFVGIEMTQRQSAHIAFGELPSGTLIAGVAGTGKTNAMHVLLQSFLANLDLFTHVYLIDGKEGVSFHRRYANRHPKVTVLWDEQEVWDLTARLVADMAERNTRQRLAGIDKQSHDLVAVVIDEMATFTHKPSVSDKTLNKRHAQFIDELAVLARKGRSVGYKLMISAQEVSEAHVPLPVRNNCQTVISFRLAIDQHASMLFGQLADLPADPRKLGTGFAIIKNGETGAQMLVKFPFLPTVEHRS